MLLGKLGQNRRISVVFAAVTLLHGLFLLIPVARQALYETPPATTLHLRLAPEPQPARQPPSPVVAAAPKPVIVPREPIELADLPVPPEQTLPPTQPAEPKAAPDAINRQILSSQFSYEKSKPLFDDQQAPEKRSDYQVWERPVLEQVLNEPVLQLPFRDTRIYLVDSYDPGFAGSVERFFDEVAVPFGWTTKNNTRFECAWILIIGGCGWGHASLFHREARRRPPDAGPGY